ncbi:hypothetical protein ACFP7A_09995 [Sporolactobacillus kofuensis]|uniref:Uncharacterized protein n=1 Tax=Sporolactobacillus kofuensis TaxID=269672 RepID=A0ABW1WFD6_9BACL|nr:hypothetical protein [Sporolactobacillus kofuensis]MCO7176206.1 hypothetical protein [Sporolactobacillus kofuensis]
MFFAVTLCFAWISVNLLIIIPKSLTKDEHLFLFLVSSLTIILSLILPAKHLYIGDPDFKDTIQTTLAFLTNRTIVFPVLTLVSVNLILLRKFWIQVLTGSTSLFIFLIYCLLEPKYTTISSIGAGQLLLYFVGYYVFIILLLRGFRLLHPLEDP